MVKHMIYDEMMEWRLTMACDSDITLEEWIRDMNMGIYSMRYAIAKIASEEFH